MVYKSHSVEVKLLALAALDDGGDVATVERLFDVSRRSLERWDQQLHERFTLAQKKLYLSSAALRQSHLSFCTYSSNFWRNLHQSFSKKSLSTSLLSTLKASPISTIYDAIKDMGYERMVLRVRRIAPQRDNDLRSKWMHFILSNFTARQMVFTDESSKDGRTLARGFGRAFRGHRARGVVASRASKCRGDEEYNIKCNTVYSVLNKHVWTQDEALY
ncbi:hypothetical protein GGX14DRAFT_642639 [Mycena pura]|uniref:Transposase n=1 Tax=Mycena pura TaxID=153505 RepID=A0AAD6YQC7_9AGAR|nr:hypothetical protein GGX14DRAFT_592179 [Mycena pura]KAJ7226063.1 hypothetical protein GGX14DRAFT_642639 [Mycena pura]